MAVPVEIGVETDSKMQGESKEQLEESSFTSMKSSSLENKPNVLSQPGTFTFTAQRIYRPAYQLRDKKYAVSEHAYNEMMRTEMNVHAGVEWFGRYGEPHYWKENQNAIQRMAAKHENVRRVVESDEVLKVTGMQMNSGLRIRVFAWKKHMSFKFESGKSYVLRGFDVKAKGNVWELTSNNTCSVTPLQDGHAFRLPFPPSNNVGHVMKVAQSCNANIETDFVGKVVSVRPYTHGAGQSIIVRDVNGEEIKIKFVYGIETEGVGRVIEPGKVIGFIGLVIHHPITRLHKYLFTDAHTQFFTHFPMPIHLKPDFVKLLFSQEVEFEWYKPLTKTA